MKIARIEVSHVAIPFDTGGPQVGVMRPWSKMDGVLVRIETDEGLVGWGEAFGHLGSRATMAVLTTMVGPWFLGKPVDAISELWPQVQNAFCAYGRNGPLQYALSGIDIALWDIAAKQAGQPLYRLLGGRQRPVELYASLMRYGGDLDAVARNVRRAYAAGFKLMEIHEQKIPAFLAAQDAVSGEAGIMLDVNCPWTVNEARAVARTIRDRDFTWLEEPVWPPEDFAGLATVRSEGTTIAAGENATTLHEFRSMFEQGAVDIVQPSITKVGGVTGIRPIIALAEAHSVQVAPHSFYWGPGYLAAAHVALSISKPPPIEIAYITLKKAPHALFDPEKPTLDLPQTPGLGFEPDLDVIESCRVSRHMIE